MSFAFNEDFWDEVEKKVKATFADISADEFKEPTHLTDARLSKLADDLGELARQHGCITHFSAPTIKDNWKEGSPSKYDVTVTWHGVAKSPSVTFYDLTKKGA